MQRMLFTVVMVMIEPADDVSSSSAGYRAGMRAAILFHREHMNL